MLDFYFLNFDALDIPQQLQELVFILFHSLLSQSQLIEFFNLIIIVPDRDVLLLEVFLELFPHNSSFINLLYLSVVFPPYGCSSSQIEYSYPCFHISGVVLNLEILPHPKKPRFIFLSIIYLTIKGRRPFLLKFIS